jgi:hypothetical protein
VYPTPGQSQRKVLVVCSIALAKAHKRLARPDLFKMHSFELHD